MFWAPQINLRSFGTPLKLLVYYNIPTLTNPSNTIGRHLMPQHGRSGGSLLVMLPAQRPAARDADAERATERIDEGAQTAPAGVMHQPLELVIRIHLSIDLMQQHGAIQIILCQVLNEAGRKGLVPRTHLELWRCTLSCDLGLSDVIFVLQVTFEAVLVLAPDVAQATDPAQLRLPSQELVVDPSGAAWLGADLAGFRLKVAVHGSFSFAWAWHHRCVFTGARAVDMTMKITTP